MPKIIFLDIDGVLRPFGGEEPNPDTFDPGCVAQLNSLLDKSGAKIVISSDWRLQFNMERLKYIFLVMKITHPIIDYTEHFAKVGKPSLPNDTLEDVRDREINSYLKKHSDITNWCAIDDLNLSVPNFVHTDFQKGLTEEDVKKALEILNKVNQENQGSKNDSVASNNANEGIDKSFIKYLLEHEISGQFLSRIFRDAGLNKSESGGGSIGRVHNIWNEGFVITKEKYSPDEIKFRIRYRGESGLRSHSADIESRRRVNRAFRKMKDILTQNHIRFTVEDDTLVVNG